MFNLILGFIIGAVVGVLFYQKVYPTILSIKGKVVAFYKKIFNKP